ncbi:MAG TPA: hypothetical protein VGD89_10000 [Flavipsychrobacter sp.]
MITQINGIEDVKTFFRQLLVEDLNFHPDTPFEDYINCESRQDTYTPEEAATRNKIMGACFEVCESINIDIYELANDIFSP